MTKRLSVSFYYDDDTGEFEGVEESGHFANETHLMRLDVLDDVVHHAIALARQSHQETYDELAKLKEDKNHKPTYIREIRRARGISQEELGRAIDIHQTQISKFESGTVATPAKHLVNIAEALRVSVAELHEHTTAEAIVSAGRSRFHAYLTNLKEERQIVHLIIGNKTHKGYIAKVEYDFIVLASDHHQTLCIPISKIDYLTV